MKPYEPAEERENHESVDLSGRDSVSDLRGEDIFDHDQRRRLAAAPRSSRLHRCRIAEIFLAALLLGTNVAWYLRFDYYIKPSNDQLNYFGFPGYQMVGFYHEWVNISRESVDGNWEGTFPTGGGVVSISREMAAEHGIPPAVESDTKPGHMLYIVAGFHDIHCMDMIRMQLYQPYGLMSEPDEVQRTHILHCIEAVRQALQCSMDPTLINLVAEWPYVPDGQLHVCRNADALLRFAEKHHDVLPGSDKHQHQHP